MSRNSMNILGGWRAHTDRVDVLVKKIQDQRSTSALARSHVLTKVEHHQPQVESNRTRHAEMSRAAAEQAAADGLLC